MKKNIFGNNENDPRLKGISSQKNNEITKINKAIFTSCKKNDKCPPWKIQAEKITHDSKKKQLIYDNAILKIYDLPVVYFPKFFHPDPSVERQSGVLLPTFNESKILGSSVKIPYFHTLSKNKDITIIPNIFNKDLFMLENEFRFKTKQSSFLADFGFTRGYKSSSTNKKKNISHLFANYKLDFDLEDYITSNLDLKIENIIGLENGTPQAKADWITSKVAEGYNDILFADDAIKNVEAVLKETPPEKDIHSILTIYYIKK